MRRASKRDTAEGPIVQAIEAAGFMCWRLLQPVDLLTWRADKGWQMLEVKTPKPDGKQRQRNDQIEQLLFLSITHTPVVKTSLEALKALGAIS